MIPSDDSILLGLPVYQVKQIASSARRLKREARRGPDGVTGLLTLGGGRVVKRTERSFPSEAHSVAHMDRLVDACVAWQACNGPALVEDASFAC